MSTDTPKTDAECLDSHLQKLSDSDLKLRSDPMHGGYMDFVPADFARTLERELADMTDQRDCLTLRLGKTQERMIDAERQRDTLAEAIRSFVTDFERVEWGWDGDCGSQELVDHLFQALAAVKGEPT